MAKAKFGPLMADVRGPVGERLMLRGRTGEIVRGRLRYRYPTQPIQQATQDRTKAVMGAWNTLTHEGAMAWNAHARTLTRTDPLSGTIDHPTG